MKANWRHVRFYGIVVLLFILSWYVGLFLIYEKTSFLKPDLFGFDSAPPTPLQRFAQNHQYQFFKPARQVSSAIEWSSMTDAARAANLVTRTYLVDPEILRRHNPVKNYFIAEGIEFPEGASAIYSAASSQLIFRNTRANHAKLEALAKREFALDRPGEINKPSDN